MARLFSISLVVLTALLLACGGDDDDSGATSSNNSSPAPASAGSGASPGSSSGSTAPPAPSGQGSGTLMVDGKTFEFQVIFCGFTPQETRNENVPFSMRGTGMDDGRAFSVDGSIVNVDLGAIKSTTHDLDVWYDDDAGNAIYTSGVPGSPAEPEFVIDGKNVSFEAEFSDKVGASVGHGTMQATCP